MDISWSFTITVAVVVIGWIVIGSQNVNEKLTDDRRRVYLKLIQEAEQLELGAEPESFKETVIEADFVSSEQMHKHFNIRRLLDVGSETWKKDYCLFLTLARFESQENSLFLRVWRSKTYRSRGLPP